MKRRRSSRVTETDFKKLADRAIHRAGGRAGEARTAIEVVPGRQYAFSILGVAQPGGSKQAFVPVHRTQICECGPIPGKLPYRREGGSIIVSVVDANPKVDVWKKHVARIAQEEYHGPLFSGAIAVRFVFYRARPDSHYGKTGLSKAGRDNPFPATKPDVLKLTRALEDALTGICYVDDALICRETIWKEYGEPPRVEITLESLAVEMAQPSLLEAAEPPPPWESQETAAAAGPHQQTPDGTRVQGNDAGTQPGTSAGGRSRNARSRMKENVAPPE